jgi:hypothetical protein
MLTKHDTIRRAAAETIPTRRRRVGHQDNSESRKETSRDSNVSRRGLGFRGGCAKR